MSRARTSSRVASIASIAAAAFLAASTAGCMGRADLGVGGESVPEDGGAPATNPDGSAKRAPGDPDCSDLPVPDLARVCSDGSSVGAQYVLSNHQCVLEFPCPSGPTPGGPTPGGPTPGGPGGPAPSCTQGALCSAGEGCGSAGSGADGCATSCTCAPSGRFQCTVSCGGGGPQPTGCAQGAPCTPGEGCGGGGGGGGMVETCFTDCECASMGYFQCTTDCQGPPVPVDAGPPLPVLDAGPGPVPDPCPGYAVPDICEVCDNGTTECAHAVLVDGQCQIEICPSDSVVFEQGAL